jgi:hypothetical protein
LYVNSLLTPYKIDFGDAKCIDEVEEKKELEAE